MGILPMAMLFEKNAYRSWNRIIGRLAYITATFITTTFNICTIGNGLEADESGFVPLSFVEFRL